MVWVQIALLATDTRVLIAFALKQKHTHSLIGTNNAKRVLPIPVISKKLE